MTDLLKVWQLFLEHKESILNVLAYLIAIGSIIVKATPTLKDDAWFKPIIQFIGKYVALDKYGPKSGAPDA